MRTCAVSSGTTGGCWRVSGCLESQKAHMAAGLGEGCPAVLLIAEK